VWRICARVLVWRELPITDTLIYPRTALFWAVAQQVAVISQRCFGRAYRSHPQGSVIHPSGKLCYILPERLFEFRNCWILSDSWALKMGPMGCPETSARNYHKSLHNNPEERSSQLLRAEAWNHVYCTTYLPAVDIKVQVSNLPKWHIAQARQHEKEVRTPVQKLTSQWPNICAVSRQKKNTKNSQRKDIWRGLDYLKML
jgi:hypothetical protein